MPSPDQLEPSTITRSAIGRRSSAECESKCGSPGHHTAPAGRGPGAARPARRGAARSRPARHVDELGAGLRRRRRRQHAVGLDLGVDPHRPVGIGLGDDDRPRWVAAREALHDRCDALADLATARDHDQVHHAGAGRDAALLGTFLARRRQRDRGPDLRDLRFDLGDAPGPRRPAQRGATDDRRRHLDEAAHRRRHLRPSRSTSCSASSGPQDPDA